MPKKFNIDKRTFHYSCLIQSGQITKSEAHALMEESIYDTDMLAIDKDYVLKKLNFTDETFEEYMNKPIRKHNEFKTDDKLWDNYFKFIEIIKKLILWKRAKRF